MVFAWKHKIAPHQSVVETQPVQILEVELTRALPDIRRYNEKTGREYANAQVLVRLHEQPLGSVILDLSSGDITSTALAPQIWETFGDKINSHLLQDGLRAIHELDVDGLGDYTGAACLHERAQFLANAPFVSIVVATRDRPEILQDCLQSLLCLHYPCYEIVVVDNAPKTSATSNFILDTYRDEQRIRYVREDRPGLSWARNRGILEARAALIAYTDDDVTVDPNWLNCLIKPFSGDPSVVCVTGLTLPAELETPAQVWFEQYGGFGKGFTPQVFDAFRNRPTNRPTSLMYPYSAGIFGSGNNMAFRTGYLRSIGGFDPALGAGTATGGGEDLSAFFKVITHGHTLMYEPAALNYHTHRRDYAGLSKQMYYYGTGLTAYLMKCLMDEPQRVFEVIGKIPLGLYYTLGRNSNKNAKKRADYPEELSRIELKGILHGPFTYLVSRKRMRTIINQFGRLEIVPGNAAEEMGSVPVPSLDIT